MTFTSNIQGTWNLLEQCRIYNKLKRIIVSTSDKVYGEQNSLSISEDAILFGRYPYDVSKVCADVISQLYESFYHLPITIVRFANIFGGGDTNWSRLIPYVCSQIVTGGDIELRSSGENKRDFIYVKDAISAMILAAMHRSRPDVRNQAFNFSYQTPRKVIDVVNAIARLAETNGYTKNSVIITNSIIGEIQDQGLNCDKAKKLLSWEPVFNFDQGLTETFEWYKLHLHKGKPKSTFI
jgi:CDP-glucose 4,6-dehydratase